jgi:HD superfamily phosphodiesterase
MCAALKSRGVAVDSDLAEGAALLHDIDKGLPPEDPYRALDHGSGGAQWLADHGYEELAPAVRDHPVNVIGNAASYKDWAASQSLEAKLVAYSDKRAHQDLVTLDERFERWFKRYPDNPMEPIAYDRFRRLERELCALAGIKKEDVRRLAWVNQTSAFR